MLNIKRKNGRNNKRISNKRIALELERNSNNIVFLHKIRWNIYFYGQIYLTY